MSATISMTAKSYYSHDEEYHSETEENPPSLSSLSILENPLGQTSGIQRIGFMACNIKNAPLKFLRIIDET